MIGVRSALDGGCRARSRHWMEVRSRRGGTLSPILTVPPPTVGRHGVWTLESLGKRSRSPLLSVAAQWLVRVSSPLIGHPHTQIADLSPVDSPSLTVSHLGA